jgi:membrane-anchored protein YejM (alkaline phosphatase superfamily)
MPLVAFILLAVVLLLMLGIACACINDHPATTIDRAVGAISSAPAVLEIWSFATVLLFVSFIIVRPQRLASRASPATLQRFLF